jgi:hypothetical protein
MTKKEKIGHRWAASVMMEAAVAKRNCLAFYDQPAPPSRDCALKTFIRKKVRGPIARASSIPTAMAPYRCRNF